MGALSGTLEYFKREEKILPVVGFSSAVEHAAMHQRLVSNAKVLIGHFRTGTVAIDALFQCLVQDMRAKHILGAVRKFFPT